MAKDKNYQGVYRQVFRRRRDGNTSVVLFLNAPACRHMLLHQRFHKCHNLLLACAIELAQLVRLQMRLGSAAMAMQAGTVVGVGPHERSKSLQCSTRKWMRRNMHNNFFTAVCVVQSCTLITCMHVVHGDRVSQYVHAQIKQQCWCSMNKTIHCFSVQYLPKGTVPLKGCSVALEHPEAIRTCNAERQPPPCGRSARQPLGFQPTSDRAALEVSCSCLAHPTDHETRMAGAEEPP